MELNAVNTIEKKLCDEESRVIYRNLINYYECGSIRSLFNRKYVYNETQEGHVDNLIDAFIYHYTPAAAPVVIFGTGIMSGHLLSILKELSIPVLRICEEAKSASANTTIDIPLISVEELLNYYKTCALLIATDYNALREVSKLINRGFPKRNLYIQHKTSKPYFSQPFLRPVENEIFIDAGGYNADSIIDFIQWCNGEYHKIYTFEPDSVNFSDLSHYISSASIPRTFLFHEGLWSSKSVLQFMNTGDMGSYIDQKGNVSIQVNALDHYVKDDRATFIKMDIEGAELEALKGARKTILANRPRLAISIYHKPEDILEIPSFIDGLNMDYRFYIRQHTWELRDTVLYAI